MIPIQSSFSSSSSLVRLSPHPHPSQNKMLSFSASPTVKVLFSGRIFLELPSLNYLSMLPEAWQNISLKALGWGWHTLAPTHTANRRKSQEEEETWWLGWQFPPQRACRQSPWDPGTQEGDGRRQAPDSRVTSMLVWAIILLESFGQTQKAWAHHASQPKTIQVLSSQRNSHDTEENSPLSLPSGLSKVGQVIHPDCT